MNAQDTLVLTARDHEVLKAHLICGDGKEAAAILLCKTTSGTRRRLLVSEMILVPHDACPVRSPVRIVWPGDYIETAIERAEQDGLLVILIHSHPGGWLEFSEVDDASDQVTMPALLAAFGSQHGSAIMTPDGAIRGRLYGPQMATKPIDLVTIAGDDIHYWWSSTISHAELAPWPLAFTSGMRDQLERLSVAVIGVSGTGSLTAEQLARMGANVTLVDFDRVEHKNLNRIVNATLADADANRLKVKMFAEAVDAYRGPGATLAIADTIASRDSVLAVSQCDVIFCCVDTHEARQIADLIAAAFLIPLFDVGVVIPTRKAGQDGVAIADVCGRVDYVQPGGSTLADRGVFTPESLRAEWLRKANPKAFEEEREAGYIKGLAEQAPSVISLNMRASSAVVMEYIARAFPFRHDPNRGFARTRFSLAAAEEEYTAEDEFERAADTDLARGEEEPLLGIPAVGKPRERA